MVWLDNSRIIAIIAVVFLHSAAGVVTGSPLGTQSWWIGNLYDSLVRWCVPVFVMISGALLLDPGKKEDLKVFYIKRLSRLLIPIIFWSAFFLMWTAIKGAMNGEPLRTGHLAKGLLSGRPYYHMWFLYMILSLYLFTPFIRIIISASSRYEIVALVTFLFIFSALNAIGEKLGLYESKLFINWFLYFLPYFILGHIVKTSKITITKNILFMIFCMSVFLTALGCYIFAVIKGLEAGLYFYDYLSITVMPMSISIFCLLKLWINPIGNESLSKGIAALTLGVYLIHPVFLEAIIDAGYGPLSFNQAVSIPVTSTVIFVMSLGVAWVISKTPYIKRII